MNALLETDGLEKDFVVHGETVRAVAGVTITVGRAETVALVGESGSGKTTTAMCVAGLEAPTGGSITFDGIDVASPSKSQRRELRRRMQVVFQDPYSSLNPRLTIGQIVREPLEVHAAGPRAEQDERVAELLVAVGLDPDDRTRFPHQFSGGQRQRIGIARALATRPELVVCDEPVSALDVSVQAQVINLFCDLQAELGLSYLFIAHDLAVVRQVAHRVAVMYLGRIVEEATADELYRSPRHPYTVALMSAAPSVDRRTSGRRIVLHGEPPSPSAHVQGCAFQTRCWKADERCRVEAPPLAETSCGHRVACWSPE